MYIDSLRSGPHWVTEGWSEETEWKPCGCWRPISPRGSWGQVFKVPGVEPARYGCGLSPREGPQGSSL